jgi:serine protease inhibitor
MINLLTCALLAAAPPSPALTKTVEGNSDFAIDLYGQLAKDRPGNLFFSPFSVSDALAMTYGGAKGATAAQMSKALHFSDDPHASFSLLNAQLTAGGKGYQVSVANRLFAAQGLTLLPAFTRLMKDTYQAPIEQLDFANAAEPSRLHINDWVAKQTHDRIKDLLVPGLIDGSTRLVLVNAIYFKGLWASAFDPKQTRPMPFDIGGKKVDVPMMSQKLTARYHESPDAQIVELPYQGGDLSMVIVVPKKELKDLKLDRRHFDGSLSSVTTEEVQVFLPRFKMTTDFRLDTALKSLGMKDAFSEGADFSGMTGSRDFSISAVVHKAFVEVNEEGTEAAAATAVVMRELAVRREPIVRADHPFVFALRDNRSDSIVFMGRVTDPRG